MKALSIILFAIIAALCVNAQVEKIVTVLPDYLIPNQDVVHTIKIEVINNHDNCKQIYLRNDKEITGIDLTGADFTNPIPILAEYGATLDVDLESWTQVPFTTWFKNMSPKSTFTFYFQSHSPIDASHLLDLIRVSKNDFSFKTQMMKDLGWNADEIIISLPLDSGCMELPGRPQ